MQVDDSRHVSDDNSSSSSATKAQTSTEATGSPAGLPAVLVSRLHHLVIMCSCKADRTESVHTSTTLDAASRQYAGAKFCQLLEVVLRYTYAVNPAGAVQMSRHVMKGSCCSLCQGPLVQEALAARTGKPLTQLFQLMLTVMKLAAAAAPSPAALPPWLCRKV